jgi:hypothetical protein
MSDKIEVRSLSKKEAQRAKPKIEVTVEFRGMEPHGPAERLEISRALTVIAGAWFPDVKAAVKVNLNYWR